MIRLVQNNLIVPRGDTGTFSIPVLSSLGENIIGVFTILDPKTNTKIFQKQVSPSGETLTVTFSHGDTVNLPVGKYLWDIKFYENPVFVDEELVDGIEVDSYYAAYKMPICEIRQTGDKLLTADGSPTTTLTPETVNFVTAAISEIQADKNVAAEKAEEAGESAQTAVDAADSASADAESAAASAASALESANTASDKSDIAIEKAQEATASATAAAQSATEAANSANAAAISATAASSARTSAEVAASNATSAAQSASESASAAEGYASQITGLNATAQTLQPEQPATASYDAATGTLTIGVPKGESFHIVKTYSSVAEMNADYNNSNVKIGDFVIISSTIEDPDNAKIYVKGAQAYTFVVDMSGSAGIQGVGIRNIQKTGTSGLTDTYTITYGDDTTTTYNVRNGEDGDEYTVLVQNTQPTQNTNKLWIPTNQGVVQEVPTVQEMQEAIAGIQVPVQDVQVNGTSVVTDGIANVPVASASTPGVVSVRDGYDGVRMLFGHRLTITPTNSSQIKNGNDSYLPVTTMRQHESAFYGLAKAAGDTTQSASSNAVGTYTDEAKAAIAEMLGLPYEKLIYRDDTFSNVWTEYQPIGVNLDSNSIVLSDATGIPTEVTQLFTAYIIYKRDLNLQVGSLPIELLNKNRIKSIGDNKVQFYQNDGTTLVTFTDSNCFDMSKVKMLYRSTTPELTMPYIDGLLSTHKYHARLTFNGLLPSASGIVALDGNNNQIKGNGYGESTAEKRDNAVIITTSNGLNVSSVDKYAAIAGNRVLENGINDSAINMFTFGQIDLWFEPYPALNGTKYEYKIELFTANSNNKTNWLNPRFITGGGYTNIPIAGLTINTNGPFKALGNGSKFEVWDCGTHF